MTLLTIEQLIDQLANLGQVVGLDAKVEAWNIHEAMQPLETRGISGVSAGWDKVANKANATLRLSDA
jgi:hypothetical protein